METDVANTLNEDSSLLFDGRMLNKLRRCNMIPRSPSDFQIFVRSLAGDTISDVVIQEVWKQIYANKTGSASLLVPEIVSESQELSLYNLSKSDKNVVDTASESLELSSRKMPKQRHGSHCGVQIFEKAEESCSENEVMSDSEIATHSSVRNQNVALHSVALVSRRELNRTISSPIVKTSEQMKLPCGWKSDNASIILEKDKMEEHSGSDCEVIEIVSPDRTNTGVRNSNSVCNHPIQNLKNKSDSDESVEILDSTHNNVRRVCPIHGNNEISKPQCSQEWNSNRKRKGMYVEADSMKYYDHVSKESVNKEKQQKNKKGRRGKYKMLRSEVKHLKSLLVNLLMSLKSPKMNDSGEGTSTTNQDNLDFILGNKQKTKKDNGLFHPKQRGKKMGSNNRTASTEKLKASAFVEVNMTRKATKSHRKKQQPAKHSKNGSVQPPIVVELNSDSSDLDNGERKKFPWREIIADELRSKSGRWLPVEKLKRKVIAKYYYSRGNVSQNTTVKFFRYLHSTAGVVVDGDMVIYLNKPMIKVSSKSEKKQFVLKTHTTTKEYKVS